VDVDAFTAVRSPRWNRLQQLAQRRRRTGAEADEMTLLYRSTASDLAAVRSAAPDPALITRLSMLLAQSRVWLTGAHHVRTSDFRRYFTRSLPAAMHRVRWWGVTVSVVVVVFSAIAAQYTLNTPEALELVGPPETRAQIAQEEFASYYTEYDGTSFTARVWTNNAWLAVQCIAFGITGFFPLFLLYNTVIQLGVAAAVMAEHGMLDIFFQLIIPHGLLELSAVFVAAGAGLRLFWTMLVPGPRPRGQALAEEARITLSVALGLAITLFISGLIEGYVTPSDVLGWPIKIAIGAVAFVAFWGFVFIAGRDARRRGATGDDDADFHAELAPIAS
jgi:uncharacterized membrane protein SpoIIM required for sporulation